MKFDKKYILIGAVCIVAGIGGYLSVPVDIKVSLVGQAEAAGGDNVSYDRSW